MRERSILRLVYDRNKNLIVRSSLGEVKGLSLADAMERKSVKDILSDVRNIHNEKLVDLVEKMTGRQASFSYGSESGSAFYTLTIKRTRSGLYIANFVRTPLQQTVGNPVWMRVVSALIVAVVVCTSVVVALVMRNDIYEKKNIDANDTVEMVSEQIDRTVSTEFGSWFDELKMIGTLLNDYPTFSGNEEKIDAILDGIRQSLPFRNVGLLIDNGSLYIDENTVISISYEELARKLVIDNQPAIDVMDLAGTEFVVFGVPAERSARRDVGRIAAIVGIADISTVSDLLSINSFNKQAIVGIIKTDGFRVAVSQNGAVESGKEYPNMFNTVQRLLTEEEYAEFEANFIADKSGMIRMVGSTENYYMYYSPLHVGGEEYASAGQWHLTIYVPESAIFSSVNEMFNTVMMLMIGTLFTMSVVIVALLLFYLHKKNKDIVTNRRLMEAEVLEATARQAEEANHAKTIFFSNMSHDMRTPLNGILGMTDIAKKHIDEPEVVNDCIRKISGAGEHLLGLVNNVLDISRIESNKVEILHEVMNVEMLCEECCSIVDGQLLTRKLNFSFNCGHLAHPDVMSDNLHMKQILINILGNAIKFTPDGGSVRFDVDEIAADDKTVTYRFVVSDTGVGMSPEFITHIFEPFTQDPHAVKAASTKGSGLGLSISLQLVQLMDGKIDVDSVEDEGTTMTITMPFEISKVTFAESEDTADSNNAQTGAEVTKNTIAGKRVLLVEDNDLNSEIASMLLTENGLLVERASDGSRACEMFAAHTEHYYDVILMDVMMPVMDGIAATKAIRASDNPNAKSVPIIAMTANAFEDDIRRTREAGMDDHLSKPIRIGEVLKAINRLTNKVSPPPKNKK